MAFHSEFPKTEIEVQDVNSSSSFNQTLISSIQWMRKCIKNTGNQTACESGVWIVRIARKFTGHSSVAKNFLLKNEIEA